MLRHVHDILPSYLFVCFNTVAKKYYLNKGVYGVMYILEKVIKDYNLSIKHIS